MLLESLEAQNFRNIEGKIPCGKNLNIIFGENGQGKTNWLEAIYLLATTKSFKTARLSEAVKFGEELAIIKGAVQTECRNSPQFASRFAGQHENFDGQ